MNKLDKYNAAVAAVKGTRTIFVPEVMEYAKVTNGVVTATAHLVNVKMDLWSVKSGGRPTIVRGAANAEKMVSSA